MYLFENLDTRTPIAQTQDAASNLRAQDRMRSLASNRFPRGSDRIVRID